LEEGEINEILKDSPDLLKEVLRGREELKEKSPEEIYFSSEFYKQFRNSIKDSRFKYRPFDVQIIGAIALHRGKIAEMKTGEGKTLVATLPVYLNALSGEGVHVVTVNEYLAKRDSEWMGKIYKFLHLSVGLIYHDMPIPEKRLAYQADITYGTNSEFGFDYLRDNMVFSKEDCSQRPLNYAIVDEVDSILIDEARTPLIISGPSGKPTNIYYKFAALARRLQKERDYQVDEKTKTVVLTEEGILRVEKELGIENLYHPSQLETTHYLMAALKALNLFKRDVDYVVKDGQVIIVDEFTGRLMPGRRWSEGLHQAIEAKEGLKIEEENQTLATITLQNYFRMYKKLAGMTGTAETEKKEFMHIYGLEVVVIPTNKPLIRLDAPDVIYKTKEVKYRKIIDEIIRAHKRGQPVLVGTISIEVSELLADMLRKKGHTCNVLNAKYHEKEAEIVSEAGQYGAITIATNMAGRGTDIKLGEGVIKCPKCCLQCRAEKDYTPEKCKTCEQEPRWKECEGDVQCGLYIMGTERHESRRIDNQLRGRSGRQGDPGMSRFFLSLEDDLMRLFGSERISGMMDVLGIEEDQPIEHKFISNAIEKAQKRVEERNFSIRKQVLEYDNVMNMQREAIYAERKKILFEEDVHDNVLSMIGTVTETIVDNFFSERDYSQINYAAFVEKINSVFPINLKKDDVLEKTALEVAEQIIDRANKLYEEKEKELGSEELRNIERYFLLEILDQRWKEHLLNMDYLEEGIGLRAYGQKDPLIEYKQEGYNLFQEMLYNIKEDLLSFLFRVELEKMDEDELVHQKQTEQLQFSTNRDSTGDIKKKPVRKEKKVGPNDPCPCGSGKKYKKCCGRNLK
jgi:preprotein translocase subunit SecA